MTKEEFAALSEEIQTLKELDVMAFISMIKAKAEQWIKEMTHGS